MPILPIPSGFSVDVTSPRKYTVHYLNGSREYTEIFAEITADKAQVDQWEKQIDPIILALAQALGPALGSVIGIIAELAVNWIIDSERNEDGSITFAFAYHYAGTAKSGIDLTAKPLPGVDSGVWKGVVDELIAAITAHNGAHPSIIEPLTAISPKGSF